MATLLLDPRTSPREHPSPAESPSVYSGTVSRIDSSGAVWAKVPRVDPVGAVLMRGATAAIPVGATVWVTFSDQREAVLVAAESGLLPYVTLYPSPTLYPKAA